MALRYGRTVRPQIFPKQIMWQPLFCGTVFLLRCIRHHYLYKWIYSCSKKLSKLNKYVCYGYLLCIALNFICCHLLCSFYCFLKVFWVRFVHHPETCVWEANDKNKSTVLGVGRKRHSCKWITHSIKVCSWLFFGKWGLRSVPFKFKFGSTCIFYNGGPLFNKYINTKHIIMQRKWWYVVLINMIIQHRQFIQWLCLWVQYGTILYVLGSCVRGQDFLLEW